MKFLFTYNEFAYYLFMFIMFICMNNFICVNKSCNFIHCSLKGMYNINEGNRIWIIEMIYYIYIYTRSYKMVCR